MVTLAGTDAIPVGLVESGTTRPPLPAVSEAVKVSVAVAEVRTVTLVGLKVSVIETVTGSTSEA